MVKRAPEYGYSGHRAYVGLDRGGLVDAEPALWHFGGTKKQAVEVYQRFVKPGGQKGQEEFLRE